MYESFFQMRNTPFTRQMPAEQLYESHDFQETLSRLKFVAQNQLFAVVTSAPGCGKSTLIRRFSEDLSKSDYLVLYLSDSKLTPRWFYQGLLNQLGLEAHINRGESKSRLQQSIEIIQGVQHKKVVCILDEAHLLDREMLEEFRFLLNYHFDSKSLMALVLVGQSELWDTKLKLQSYAAIRQRIDVCCTLHHLDQAETEQYVRRHLEYSGTPHEIFTAKAFEEIYRCSTGIPRMINRVCEKALMYASQQQKRLIDDHMVRFVVEHEMLDIRA